MFSNEILDAMLEDNETWYTYTPGYAIFLSCIPNYA